MRLRHLVCISLGALLAAPLASQELLTHEAGARVVAFSSEYGGGWNAQYLVEGADENPEAMGVWCSANDAPFPHWAVIELPRSTWLTTLIFNNALPDEPSYPGISAKDVTVQVSDQGADAGFHTVASFRLERNRNGQEVRVEPTQARWIKVIVTSNWGNPTWTELGQLGAIDDGSRAVDLGTALRERREVHLYGLYFDFGAATLRDESAPVLDQIALLMRNEATLSLVVEGHTDAVGDAAANQRLSEQRAAAVVAALTSRGVPGGRLRAAGMGATHPVADNDTPAGRARNRRVTIRVQ